MTLYDNIINQVVLRLPLLKCLKKLFFPLENTKSFPIIDGPALTIGVSVIDIAVVRVKVEQVKSPAVSTVASIIRKPFVYSEENNFLNFQVQLFARCHYIHHFQKPKMCNMLQKLSPCVV